MPNRKFATSRAIAFWLGLTLHLGLGAALYHQTTSQNTARTAHNERILPVTPSPAKP